jgi:hypothetical protein
MRHLRLGDAMAGSAPPWRRRTRRLRQVVSASTVTENAAGWRLPTSRNDVATMRTSAV